MMKKRLLSALLALCMLPSLMGAAATPTDDVLDIDAMVDGVVIDAVPVDGEHYLFLPANADIRALSLQFALNGEETDAVTLHGENKSEAKRS